MSKRHRCTTISWLACQGNWGACIARVMLPRIGLCLLSSSCGLNALKSLLFHFAVIVLHASQQDRGQQEKALRVHHNVFGLRARYTGAHTHKHFFWGEGGLCLLFSRCTTSLACAPVRTLGCIRMSTSFLAMIK